MEDEEVYQKLIDAAFHYVSFRPRSGWEIHDFLLKKCRKFKVDDDLHILDKVSNRLKELGYWDDSKFIEWWVGARQGHSHKGKRLIKLELMQKGIPKNLVDDFFRDHDQTEDSQKTLLPEKSIAEKAIQKKLSLWQKLPQIEQKKKIYQYLSRRGFESEIIMSIIDEILGKDYNNTLE